MKEPGVIVTSQRFRFLTCLSHKFSSHKKRSQLTHLISISTCCFVFLNDAAGWIIFRHHTTSRHFRLLSSDQGATGWLGHIWDELLPSDIGVLKSHEKRIPTNRPVLSKKINHASVACNGQWMAMIKSWPKIRFLTIWWLHRKQTDVFMSWSFLNLRQMMKGILAPNAGKNEALFWWMASVSWLTQSNSLVISSWCCLLVSLVCWCECDLLAGSTTKIARTNACGQGRTKGGWSKEVIRCLSCNMYKNVLSES